ncbi:collagen, type I, alpha 1b-like [Equus asinus]|uniref:collagen, type I, alpha 1b-like n=1 Tax=Equus asinus TaxID=9793 RepID=UPI0038F6D88C
MELSAGPSVSCAAGDGGEARSRGHRGGNWITRGAVSASPTTAKPSPSANSRCPHAVGPAASGRSAAQQPTANSGHDTGRLGWSQASGLRLKDTTGSAGSLALQLADGRWWDDSASGRAKTGRAGHAGRLPVPPGKGSAQGSLRARVPCSRAAARRGSPSSPSGGENLSDLQAPQSSLAVLLQRVLARREEAARPRSSSPRGIRAGPRHRTPAAGPLRPALRGGRSASLLACLMRATRGRRYRAACRRGALTAGPLLSSRRPRLPGKERDDDQGQCRIVPGARAGGGTSVRSSSAVDAPLAPWPLTARPEPRGLESRLRGRGERGERGERGGRGERGAGRARAGPRSGRAGDAEPSQVERSASCRERHAEPAAACGSAPVVLRRRAPRTPPLPRLPQNFFLGGPASEGIGGLSAPRSLTAAAEGTRLAPRRLSRPAPPHLLTAPRAARGPRRGRARAGAPGLSRPPRPSRPAQLSLDCRRPARAPGPPPPPHKGAQEGEAARAAGAGAGAQGAGLGPRGRETKWRLPLLSRPRRAACVRPPPGSAASCCPSRGPSPRAPDRRAFGARACWWSGSSEDTVTLLSLLGRLMRYFLLRPETLFLLCISLALWSYFFHTDEVKTIVKSSRDGVKMVKGKVAEIVQAERLGGLDVLEAEFSKTWEFKSHNVAVYSIQGRRDHMEDRFEVLTDLANKSHPSIFGIFDGHGGELGGSSGIGRRLLMASGMRNTRIGTHEAFEFFVFFAVSEGCGPMSMSSEEMLKAQCGGILGPCVTTWKSAVAST